MVPRYIINGHEVNIFYAGKKIAIVARVKRLMISVRPNANKRPVPLIHDLRKLQEYFLAVVISLLNQLK